MNLRRFARNLSSVSPAGVVSTADCSLTTSRGDDVEGFDRRRFLKGSSVAAGLAGAMTIVPGALPALARSTSAGKGVSSSLADRAAAEQRQPALDTTAEPVVAHIRDAGMGHIDVFVGTKHFSVQDRSLAKRIVSAAR
jgi:hypothetical protein